MRTTTILLLLACACGSNDPVGDADAAPDVVGVKDVAPVDHFVQDVAVDAGFQCKAISWWTADNTTADKLAYNNLTAVEGGTAVYATGKYGSAFDFTNGPALEAPIPAGVSGLLGLTIEGWITITGCANDSRVFDYSTPGKNDGWVLDVTSDQHVRVQVGNASVKSIDALTVGTPTHVALTFSGTSLRVFIDGSADGSIDVSANVPYSNSPLRLGSSNAGTLQFCGTVDELMVYGRALPDDEILAIHDNGPTARCSN